MTMTSGYTAGGYGGQQQQQQQQQQNAGGYGNRNYGNGGNSYSGGSNSSYQQQQAGGGGGFFNNNNTYGGGQSSSQGQSYGQQQGFSSSPGGGRKTTADKHSVRPVTIKQLWSAVQATGDQPFKLDGCQLEQVTFVGQIERVKEFATNLTYQLGDSTEKVEVVVWSGQDDSEVNLKLRNECREGVYVRVFGHLKSFQTKRNVVSFFMRPVVDHNEISMHYLDAIYHHLYFSKGPLLKMQDPNQTTQAQANPFQQNPQQQQLQNMNGGPPQFDYMNNQQPNVQQTDQEFFDNNGTFNGVQKAIISYCKRESGEPAKGNHEQVIANSILPTLPGVNTDMVIQELHFLVEEGHLYQTVDEHHFCTTL